MPSPSPPSKYHLLHRSWKWYVNIKRFSSTGDWTQEIQDITSTPMDSVETFWGVFDKLCRVEELPAGTDYMFFRSDITPMWEDKANEGGGRWSFCVNKSTRDMNSNKAWEEILMMLVGNKFEYEENICGAVVGKKKSYDRISIWLKETPEDDIKKIGKLIRETINLSKGIALNYQFHNDIIDKKLKPQYIM